MTLGPKTAADLTTYANLVGPGTTGEGLGVGVSVAINEVTNEVIAGIRMPKDTAEQLEARSKAIRAGYRIAAEVPLQTAKLCRSVLDLCQQAADIGNEAVMSDAGVGALMARAGVQGAIHNVRINLPHTKDEAFIAEMTRELGTLLSESKALCESIQEQVERSFGA